MMQHIVIERFMKKEQIFEEKNVIWMVLMIHHQYVLWFLLMSVLLNVVCFLRLGVVCCIVMQ